MLSRAQTNLYWRTWSSICEQNGWSDKTATGKNDLRYALHARAGLPHSMTQFRNQDLNTFLRFSERLLGVRVSRNRDRENLLWRIRQDATAANLDEAYIRKLSTDLTGLACYEELALDDLTNLRNAIHNRAKKRRQYAMDAKPRAFAPVASDPF